MEALVIEPTIAPVGTDYITRWSHRLALSRQPMLRAVLEHYFHDYSRHDSFSTFMSIWHLYVVRYQYQNFTTPFKPLENSAEAGPLRASGCGAGVEGFAEPQWARIADWIKPTGGTIDYIDTDEPYYYAHSMTASRRATGLLRP